MYKRQIENLINETPAVCYEANGTYSKQIAFELTNLGKPTTAKFVQKQGYEIDCFWNWLAHFIVWFSATAKANRKGAEYLWTWLQLAVQTIFDVLDGIEKKAKLDRLIRDINGLGFEVEIKNLQVC